MICKNVENLISRHEMGLQNGLQPSKFFAINVCKMDGKL